MKTARRGMDLSVMKIEMKTMKCPPSHRPRLHSLSSDEDVSVVLPRIDLRTGTLCPSNCPSVTLMRRREDVVGAAGEDVVAARDSIPSSRVRRSMMRATRWTLSTTRWTCLKIPRVRRRLTS
jgi:hypothetical protein